MTADSPTELELLILKVLWQRAPLTAGEIRAELARGGRRLAHTSVLTMLQRMVAKQQLQQLDPVQGKAFRFQPLVSDRQVTQGMLGSFVDRVFDGSAEAAVLSLFESAELDSDTVKRLRKAVNQKLRELNDE